ncbi:MAG: hypothetical protein WAM60_24700 [Candidatus Promineifilaceae bacterium]
MTPSNTSLSPTWRLPVRLAFIVFTLGCILIFTMSTTTTIRSPLPNCGGSEDCSSTVFLSQDDTEIAAEMGLPFPLLSLSLIFSLGARLSMAIVGLIIFWRRSDDWVALLLAGALISVLLEANTVTGIYDVINRLLFGIGIILFLPLPFVFPNGRFIPRRGLWIILPMAVIYPLGYIFFIETAAFTTIQALIMLVWFILAIPALLYRYFRVSNALERQQTKWVVVGLFAMMCTAMYYTYFYSFYPPTEPSQARVIALLVNLVLYLTGYSIFSSTVLVAMLRYRLWDIDILIRRTLQYGLISTVLGLIYFGSVVVVQGVINGISGRSQPSQLTIAFSTLLIAALFNPLRRRIQSFVDRRFYRRKYDAVRILAQFASATRDEVDVDRLSAALLDIVEETMQPNQVSLWFQTTRK